MTRRVPIERVVANGDVDADVDAEHGTSIKSVERAAAILAVFQPQRPHLALAEVSATLGISKATAHRYAAVLRATGLLSFDRRAGTYSLGPQVLTLAAAAGAGLALIDLAGPVMERLVGEVNETVVLSLWEGDSPIVVRVADGTDRLVRVSVRAGARLEWGSAQHKVFAALLPEHDVPELHDDTARSRALRDEIEDVRASGIAFGSPGRHGVRTVAAPVFGDGRLVAVLALLGTTASLADDISSPAAKALRDAAATLTAQLGDSGHDDHRT